MNRMITFIVATGLLWSQASCAQKHIKNLNGKSISIHAIEDLLHEWLDTTDVPGLSLAIINDGQVSYHKTLGVVNIDSKEKVVPRTIFEAASLSKPLFVYLCMMAVDQGILDLDKPLYQYTPLKDLEYDSRHQLLTARMVLAHTTGLPNWRKEGRPLELLFEPNSSFEYSGEGYQYLATVLAHIYETDDDGLEELFQKKLAIPLGMETSSFIPTVQDLDHKASPHRDRVTMADEDINSEFGAAYSLHTNALDYAQWMKALIDGRLLSQSSRKDLFKPQVQLPADAPQRAQGVDSWTLGFAHVPLPFGLVYAHGGNNPGFSSLMVLSLEKEWGFVMFTNADQSDLALRFFYYLHSLE